MSDSTIPRVYAAPFTPASTQDVPFAECDAYRTLERQIRLYARGELAGQSILVAGHRGSGKTTVTLRAIEKIQGEWANSTPPDGVCCAKPFPVYLHGSDLLGNPRADDEHRMLHVLTEISRSLHRAVAKEIADQFRIVLSKAPDKDIELAHRIRLELDGFPKPGSLRQYWDAAGVLKSGIFPPRPARRGAALGSASPDHVLGDPETDQGMREIVAIHSLAWVCKRVGKDPDADSGADAPPTAAPGPNRENMTALSPVASLGSGLAVALIGIGSKELGATTAALAGLATTAVSYLFLHLATAPPKSQTLLSHYDVSSMNRALPALIGRIGEMGLVPVFMVDELDKVPDLAESMRWLIGHAKWALADRGFWCYLVDRAYYEILSAGIRQDVHPVESTFFGQRALTHYRPEDLIEFADKTWTVSSEENGWSREAALRFAVLMSGCHPGNLQQVRAAYPDGGGAFRLPSDSRAETGVAIAVLMQVAVEFVFRQQGTRQRLRLETGFEHTVLDVLYYPARCWTAAGEDCTELAVSSGALVEYLKKHTGLDYAKTTLASEFANLRPCLEQITAYLQEPRGLSEDLDREGAADLIRLLDAKAAGLFRNSARMPLERIEERPGILRWRFDQFGYPLTPCAIMEALELEWLEKQGAKNLVSLANWVVAFDEALRDLSAPRDKSGKVLRPDEPLGLAGLLNSVVAPVGNLSWESAITAARSAQARHMPDRADMLLSQVWEAAQVYGKRMRVALLGALLASSPGGDFASRLTAFVQANKLEPGTPESNDDPALGAVNRMVDGRAREDELLSTLYSQAVRQEALRPGLWLQNVRDLAAYLRADPVARDTRRNRPW